ncbi:hypothetical protein D3C76_1573610 [compost metagenome]
MSRIFKVHDVTAVVLNNKQRPLLTSRATDRLVDLNLGWRSKHIATHGCIQHTATYEPGMGRFMPTSTTANKCNFIGVDLFFRNHFKFIVKIQLRMR